MSPPPERFNMARYCIEKSAKRTPDKTALILAEGAKGGGFQDRSWTYKEIEDAVLKVAAGLSALGLDRGDRVMIRLGNTIEYALLYFGAMAGGFVALPSSAELTDGEAHFLLENSGARVLAVPDDLKISESGASALKIIKKADIDTFIAGNEAADYADTAADDPAFLIYTSGTTGLPKGVLHGHRHAWGRRPMYRGWYGIEQDDIVLHAGAFNWTYTLGVGLTDPWANGATTVLFDGPRDPAVWPKLVAAYGATLFAAVPSLYRQILKYGEDVRPDLATLRHGLAAAEPLRPELLHEWRLRVGTELYEAIGMSEMSTYVSHSPAHTIREGCPGRSQPGRRVAIVSDDPEPKELPPGEIGLLAVHRSDPGLMLGYWDRPDEEAEVLRGEWFVGGDMAQMDEDGYIWFHGRLNDLMNAMGYRVSPVEVEEALAQHPAIHEIAVTELRVREDVSVIAAFAVLEEGAELSLADLENWAEDKLAAYKRPRELVLTNALPQTRNGKILRRELPEIARKQGISVFGYSPTPERA